MTAPTASLRSNSKRAVSDYLDWEALAYWVRAVMGAHRGMPRMVAELLRGECPGFLEHLKAEGARLEDPTTVWRRLIAWVDDHVFGSAKAEGWFEAITFFARSSLHADRTVAYWAACDRHGRGAGRTTVLILTSGAGPRRCTPSVEQPPAARTIPNFRQSRQSSSGADVKCLLPLSSSLAGSVSALPYS